MAKTSLVSIIAPVFNEELVIKDFVNALQKVARSLSQQYDFEIILIDDGSQDRSCSIIKQLAAQDPRIRLIELRRNYGQTAALQAGFDAAEGDIYLTLDADLQHFPDEIPQFLTKLGEGYDIVCGWRRIRQEGAIRRWPSRAANLLLQWISKVNIHDFGTTFRAYRSEIANELSLMGEFHRFIPVIATSFGARIAEIPIRNIARPKGKSNYGIGRTAGVFLDLFVLYFFVHYLDRPMRAFGKLAAAVFMAGMIILTVLLVHSQIAEYPAVRERSGWFLMSILLLLASLQLLLAGVLAEILVRIHFDGEERRVYKVRKEWTADDFAERNPNLKKAA